LGTGSETENAGTGSETENAQIAGLLVHEDGKPAVNVNVSVRPADTLADITGFDLLQKVAAADIFTTTTNDTGAYTIDSGALNPGIYVIEGDDGEGNLVLIDSVVVLDAESQITVPEDTLKPAGALKGIIVLSEGGDPKGVLALVFGIDRIIRVNNDGSFKFEGLAEAEYDLRFIPTIAAGQYGILDTLRVGVVSADTTDLDTLELPFEGIPTVKNLNLEYDTLLQVVTLTWDATDPNLVKGYNVYRKHSDSDFVKINTSLIADTTFSDSSVNQDQLYEYKITAVDPGDNEGDKGVGMFIAATSAYVVTDTVYQIGEEFYSMAFFEENIYTVTLSGLVQVFDQNENVIKSWNTITPLHQFEIYNALSIKNRDTLLIIDENNTVGFYDSDGTPYFDFTVPFQVRGFTVMDSIIYLGGADTKQVSAYSMTGEFLFNWSQRGGGTSDFGPILELVNIDSNIYVLEGNDYPPYGASRFLIKYDRQGNFLTQIAFDEENHIGFRLAEQNRMLYLATHNPGYIIDDKLKIKAKFNLFETQTGILPLSTTSFLVADKIGYFHKYEVK